MRAKKGELRSSVVTRGITRIPARAMLRGTGLSDEDIDQPFVGVVTTQGEMSPCNMNLAQQAASLKNGVRSVCGTPREFTTISVSDGLAMAHSGMKFSLISREIIADSVEAVVRAHQYDALAGIGGCDKNMPGLLMAMVRLNVPAVFLYGGSALPGRARGQDVTLAEAYEGVGRVLAGEWDADELDQFAKHCLPTIGGCPGQYTANTMAMVAEALGMAPLGSSTIPAVFSERVAVSYKLGRDLMHNLHSTGPLPRDLVTRESLQNACAVVSATGGSTNAFLHIPAIAHEAGIR